MRIASFLFLRLSAQICVLLNFITGDELAVICQEQKVVKFLDYPGGIRYPKIQEKLLFLGERRIKGMDMPAVSLVYSDEKFEVWVDAEKDNITLSMTDRGVTLLFTRDEWLEFQEVIGNIMLEEEEAEEVS
jgi:hypothetical protein